MADPETVRSTHPLSVVPAWVIILIIVVSLILPFPVAWLIWPLSFDDPDLVPQADAAAFVGFYGLAVALLYSFAARRNVTWQDLPLSIPARREAVRDCLLAVPLLALAVASIFLLYLPMSYIWPDLVQSYLLDPLPTIIARWDGDAIVATILNVLSVVVLAPVVEEVFFRGFLLNRWIMKYGTVLGVAFSSAVFALLHADILGAIVFSVFLAMIYLRSGSLAGPILIHAVNNLIVTLFEATEVAVYGEVRGYTVAEFQSDWWVAILAALISIPWLLWYWSQHIMAPRAALRDDH